MLTWLALGVSIICLFAIDLGLTRHQAARLTIVDALMQTGFWISIALAFGFYIYFSFDYNIFPVLETTPLTGEQALSQYMNVYFLERMLSFDNLFVMVLVFQMMKIPVHMQYRILFYGLILTIVVRVSILVLGVSLWESFNWMNYILGAFLLFGAVRLIAGLSGKHRRSHDVLARYLMRLLPTTEDISSGRFIVRQASSSGSGKLKHIYPTAFQISITSAILILNASY